MNPTPELEAVARAIEAERWRIAIEQVNGARIDSLEGSRRTAKAAVLALQEPTEGMIRAGEHVDWPTDVASAKEHWKAMIGYVLGERE
jgi:hypothetical protein